MIAASVWQQLLEAFGRVLAFLYDAVGNYGIAIVLLTILVRVLLLPLTIKQTRSMQQMQQIQPMVKEIQRKYKGDRQKMNEELMKLYREHRVNPLGGCFPLVLQLPVFFALFSVLRGDPNKVATGSLPAVAHLPAGSALAQAIRAGQANFLGMNLGCSPSQAGRGLVEVFERAPSIDCGGSWIAAVPFYLVVALMVFTTWYQQKQMQRMSGQMNPQMVMMGRIMPVFLGFISLTIPAGVLLYWVTTNVWQVGQQHVMIRMREQAQPSKDGQRAGGEKQKQRDASTKRDAAPANPPAKRSAPKEGAPGGNGPAGTGGARGGASTSRGKGGSRRNGSRKKRRKR